MILSTKSCNNTHIFFAATTGTAAGAPATTVVTAAATATAAGVHSAGPRGDEHHSAPGQRADLPHHRLQEPTGHQRQCSAGQPKLHFLFLLSL